MTDYTNLRKIVTGDIIVKCRFGNEIRRIPINGVPTYDELCLMMYRVFKQDIKPSQDISLKYQDEEGDMISLLDDVDITHAISISNLLKVTVYDKSNQPKHQPQPQRPTSSAEISSLMEIRDKLDQLIKSLAMENKEGEKAKEEPGKKMHRLTPAELASFLSNDTENKETFSVKELTSLSPKAPSTGTIPYYPPPSNATDLSAMTTPSAAATSQPQVVPQQQQQQQPQQQQHQLQQQPQQQQQQQPHPSSYIQTPPPVSQMPASQQQQPRPPTTATQAQLGFGHANQSGSGFIPYYPPPKNEMRPPPQQQQPPQQRQGYYVPPPPSSMNTPQLPPQPFRPPQHW
ncbi:unnamed protein product [Mucor fragilis]